MSWVGYSQASEEYWDSYETGSFYAGQTDIFPLLIGELSTLFEDGNTFEIILGWGVDGE